MRSSFNILWVDDQEQNLTPQKDRIEIALNKEGFELEAIFAANSKQAENLVTEEIYGDNIDLILMDYDLGEGKDEGHKVLSKLRKILKYKEVIFYSGRETNDLRQAIIDENLEGVFCCDRENLIVEVKNVFEVLIKKTLDVNHSRGIVLGMACEIDSLIKQALAHEFDTNESRRNETKKNIGKASNEFPERAKRVVSAFENLNISKFDEIHKIKESKHLLTSEKMARFLRKILDDPDEGKFSEDIKNYIVHSIPKRNDLAHLSVKQKNGFVSVFKDSDGNELTKDDLRETRRQFLTILQNLRELRNAQKQNNTIPEGGS